MAGVQCIYEKLDMSRHGKEKTDGARVAHCSRRVRGSSRKRPNAGCDLEHFQPVSRRYHTDVTEYSPMNL